jgi:hypothetical protein
MPRYFFDIYDGGITKDNEGHELPDLAAVRSMAMGSLPAVAADEIPADGDRQSFVVVARCEAGHAVYTATLSYVGMSLPDPLSGGASS